MNKTKNKLYDIWNKLPGKLKKAIQNLYNTPLLMFTSLAILICVIVLTITFTVHEQAKGSNPLNTLSGQRSHVLDSEVAALYDSLDRVIIDRTNSPQVVSGVDTSTQHTQINTVTSTTNSSASATTTNAPSTEIDFEDDYTDLTLPTAPVYERDPNISVEHPTPKPSRAPQYIYPTEAPAATVINCSFPYGTDVTQSEILIEVHAGDDTGNSVEAKRMTVTLNNAPVEARYTHSNGAVTYALTLSAGANQLVVQAPNSVGVMSKLEQVLNYTPPTTPMITISVEATTVGLGYLIPPTQIVLEENQPISYYVANLLAQNGYVYTHDGTIENSFYLKTIGKTNAFATPSIPEDLLEAMKKDGNDPGLFQSYNPANFSPDYLGEFNFTNKSGWLYTVNNQNLNLGMSLVLPNANDFIRVRYSLANGKDIGTFVYSNGTNGSYEKQW